MITPRQIEIIIVLLLILSGWAYGGWQKHELNVYQQNQADQIAENVILKTIEDTQHAQDTISIASGYSTQLDALTKRLHSANAQDLSRQTNMSVASGGRNGSPMPGQTSAASQSDATSAQLSRVPADNVYENAMKDVVQIGALQEFILKVCM